MNPSIPLTTEGLFPREHVEHWLSQQPDDRRWVYRDCWNCVCSTFAREFHGFRMAATTPISIIVGSSADLTDLTEAEQVALPKWLIDALMEALLLRVDPKTSSPTIIYARDLKRLLGLSLQSEHQPPTQNEQTTEETKERNYPCATH